MQRRSMASAVLSMAVFQIFVAFEEWYLEALHWSNAEKPENPSRTYLFFHPSATIHSITILYNNVRRGKFTQRTHNFACLKTYVMQVKTFSSHINQVWNKYQNSVAFRWQIPSIWHAFVFGEWCIAQIDQSCTPQNRIRGYRIHVVKRAEHVEHVDSSCNTLSIRITNVTYVTHFLHLGSKWKLALSF